MNSANVEPNCQSRLELAQARFHSTTLFS